MGPLQFNSLRRTVGLLFRVKNKMASLMLAFCLIVVLTVASADSVNKNYESPKYQVLKKTKEFEIRKYQAYSFAVASEPGMGMFWAGGKNFKKLFRYIRGNNEEGEKIAMTVPVIVPIKKNEFGDYIKDYSMMFWLPEKYQCEGCAPTPRKASREEDQVEIIQWEEKIAYVRSYGFYSTESLVRYHETKLRESLKEAGIHADLDYEHRMVYSASYNAPFEVFGRHNEVMFMQKE